MPCGELARACNPSSVQTGEGNRRRALRYQEVDEKGEVIEQAWAKIGTLYVRKSAFERGAAFPQLLRVTVETAGAG
jgi:hypothetical protein